MYESNIPGLARAHQEELLREAEQRRLRNSARRSEPSLRARLLSRVGGALISIGSRLLEKHEPLLAGGSCICHDVTGKVLG